MFTFHSTNYTTTGYQPYGVAIADLNGDGIPDLAFGDGGNTVTWSLGNGAGGFNYDYGSSTGDAAGLAVVDVNGNGRPDLVVTGNSGLTVLLNTGTGTLYGPPATYPGGSTGVAVGVLDGDAAPDVVTIDTTDDIYVSHNDGGGGFQNNVGYHLNDNVGNSQTVTLAYLNGATYPYALIGNSNGLNIVAVGYYGMSDEGTLAHGYDVTAIATADVNHDGHPDIVFLDPANQTVNVVLANPGGGFDGDITSYYAGSGADAMVLADLNDDGIIDIAVADYVGNTVSILQGNYDGSFDHAVTVPTDPNPTGIAAADLNGDGHTDLVVTYKGGPAYGGADILLAVPCFRAATPIETPTGPRPVETLAIGDLVATADGIPRPVKWLGRRTYTAAQVAANPQLRPVLIRAGALAPNLPRRDLALSPQHALFLDGALVPAASLVNHASIRRDARGAPIAYFHIELADHALVFAEGAAAETFLDQDSRLLFDNADEYFDIYGPAAPPAAPPAWPTLEGAPLEALRARLAEPPRPRSAARLRGHVERLADGRLQGWAIDEANPDIPAAFDLLLDDRPIARIVANQYRIDLDHAGLADGRGGFSHPLPTTDPSRLQLRHTGGAMLPMPVPA